MFASAGRSVKGFVGPTEVLSVISLFLTFAGESLALELLGDQSSFSGEECEAGCAGLALVEKRVDVDFASSASSQSNSPSEQASSNSTDGSSIHSRLRAAQNRSQVDWIICNF